MNELEFWRWNLTQLDRQLFGNPDLTVECAPRADRQRRFSDSMVVHPPSRPESLVTCNANLAQGDGERVNAVYGRELAE